MAWTKEAYIEVTDRIINPLPLYELEPLDIWRGDGDGGFSLGAMLAKARALGVPQEEMEIIMKMAGEYIRVGGKLNKLNWMRREGFWLLL